MKFHYVITKDGNSESYGVTNSKTELIQISDLVKDENCKLKLVNRLEFLKNKRKIDTKTIRKRSRTFKIERIDYLSA